MDRACAVCGRDMHRKESWEKRGRRRICMACGPTGYRFDARGNVLPPQEAE
jgi:hypothetical protein